MDRLTMHLTFGLKARLANSLRFFLENIFLVYMDISQLQLWILWMGFNIISSSGNHPHLKARGIHGWQERVIPSITGHLPGIISWHQLESLHHVCCEEDESIGAQKLSGTHSDASSKWKQPEAISVYSVHADRAFNFMCRWLNRLDVEYLIIIGYFAASNQYPNS